jgi:hypothetical protein
MVKSAAQKRGKDRFGCRDAEGGLHRKRSDNRGPEELVGGERLEVGGDAGTA